MSLSILARCARTGQIGIAMASRELAGGASLDAAIQRGVGGIVVQGAPDPRLNRLAVNLLAQGWSPRVVLAQLASEDQDFAARQVAVIDRENRVAISSPGGGQPRSAQEGQGVAVLAAGAEASASAEAMLRAFDANQEPEFDARLLAALEAGAAATHEGLRSAAMVVWGTLDYSALDLRVDLHDQPVRELRRVYDDFKPTVEFYEARARNPRMVMNAREFAGLLESRKAKSA